ncbi:hypothetical protein QCE63_29705 [Caballeronia sp. LZ065]|nr:hypothetical protein [Caballeronia sp. LZ065]
MRFVRELFYSSAVQTLLATSRTQRSFVSAKLAIRDFSSSPALSISHNQPAPDSTVLQERAVFSRILTARHLNCLHPFGNNSSSAMEKACIAEINPSSPDRNEIPCVCWVRRKNAN